MYICIICIIFICKKKKENWAFTWPKATSILFMSPSDNYKPQKIQISLFFSFILLLIFVLSSFTLIFFYFLLLFLFSSHFLLSSFKHPSHSRILSFDISHFLPIDLGHNHFEHSKIHLDFGIKATTMQANKRPGYSFVALITFGKNTSVLGMGVRGEGEKLKIFGDFFIYNIMKAPLL